MAINVAKEVSVLRYLTVSELRDWYNEVFGEDTNRDGHVYDYAEIALARACHAGKGDAGDEPEVVVPLHSGTTS